MFEELHKPEYIDGNPNEPSDFGWAVCIKSHFSRFYTLHTDGEFKWYHDSDITAYFPTEVAAHETAANYYNEHGLVYPYTGAWAAARDKENNILTNANESQTMVFT